MVYFFPSCVPLQLILCHRQGIINQTKWQSHGEGEGDFRIAITIWISGTHCLELWLSLCVEVFHERWMVSQEYHRVVRENFPIPELFVLLGKLFLTVFICFHQDMLITFIAPEKTARWTLQLFNSVTMGSSPNELWILSNPWLTLSPFSLFRKLASNSLNSSLWSDHSAWL